MEYIPEAVLINVDGQPALQSAMEDGEIVTIFGLPSDTLRTFEEVFAFPMYDAYTIHDVSSDSASVRTTGVQQLQRTKRILDHIGELFGLIALSTFIFGIGGAVGSNSTVLGFLGRFGILPVVVFWVSLALLIASSVVRAFPERFSLTDVLSMKKVDATWEDTLDVRKMERLAESYSGTTMVATTENPYSPTL